MTGSYFMHNQAHPGVIFTITISKSSLCCSLYVVTPGSHLSLQVKGHHGEAQVEQEVTLLEALQGPAHAKGHPIRRPDEQAGADDVDHAHTQYAHKPNLGTWVSR